MEADIIDLIPKLLFIGAMYFSIHHQIQLLIVRKKLRGIGSVEHTMEQIHRIMCKVARWEIACLAVVSAIGITCSLHTISIISISLLVCALILWIMWGKEHSSAKNTDM